MSPVCRCLAGMCGLFAASLQATEPVSSLPPEQLEFFEARIRPVLVEHCYECHSGQGGTEAKGGLRLDHAAGWRDGGDSGPAVLPAKPEESLLLQVLRYETMEMPPDGQLAPEVIADFEQWIRMGAPDPRTAVPTAGAPARVIDIAAGREFWSFRPLSIPATPTVQETAWSRTWMDDFVLAKLEATGIAPSPDVDAERLLRRVSYDLVGLPPSVEELQAFQQGARVDLEAELAAAVDRRLESPEFGTHWGRHWLDVARYADSNGGDFNATFHDAWRYRDYVIRSFNEDRPFDQFIVEQIAGDLLPAASDAEREEQVIATGFLMLGPKMLSERDKEKLRMDVVDEQVSSVGSAFLGLTLGCARCHDHKFDPIPTTDYYALAGIFRSTQALDGETQKYVSDYTRVALPIEPEHAARLAAHEARVKEIDQRLAKAKKALEEFKSTGASQRSLGVTVDDEAAEKVGMWKASTHVNRYIGQGYVHDDKQGKGEKSITFTPMLKTAGEYEVRFAFANSGGRDRRVPVHVHHAGGETVVHVNQEETPPIEKLFVVLGRFTFEAGDAGRVTVSTEGTTGHVLADAVQFIPVDELSAAATAGSEPDPARVAELTAAVEQIEKDKKAAVAAAPPPAPKAIAVREATDRGDCCVCIRGEHNRLGPTVPRGFLQVALYGDVPNFTAKESGRRQLAEWIADPRHPLTARVLVNRIWAHLLGEGIVRTVDNFGQLGEAPTHPELLDRLASEFIAHGWSVKRVIREIVLSRVYRQAATHRGDAFLADPENRLLWRAHRKRLPAEALRDTMLLVSARLDAESGGSPVQGMGTLVTDNNANSEGYKSSDSYRRSVYMPIIRNELPSMLAAFDFADPDFVTGRRNETNVPTQSLLLLNSPFVRESSTAAAQLLLTNASGDDAGRVAWAYQTVLSRTPTGTEVDRALAFIDSLRQPAEGQAPDEAGPWSRLLQALFASTEFRLLD